MQLSGYIVALYAFNFALSISIKFYFLRQGFAIFFFNLIFGDGGFEPWMSLLEIPRSIS